jgi:ABC-type sugar transport system permease subunit
VAAAAARIAATYCLPLLLVVVMELERQGLLARLHLQMGEMGLNLGRAAVVVALLQLRQTQDVVEMATFLAAVVVVVVTVLAPHLARLALVVMVAMVMWRSSRGKSLRSH